MIPNGPDRPDDPDVGSMAGLYALNALEGDDIAKFEHYQAVNPAAANEVAGFRETAALLAMQTAEPAPNSLRTEVLGQLGQVRQEPVRLKVIRAERRHRAARRVAAIAAAVLLVAAIGFGGYLIGASGNEPSNEIASTSQELSRVMAHDDATVLRFSGDTPARLIYTSSGGAAVVIADAMAAPPAGHVYELWHVRGEKAQNVGTFTPEKNGVVHQGVRINLAPGDVVGVTVEPAGGSETPTTPMIMNTTI